MNDVFNIKELALYLRCSQSFIRQLVKTKSIKYYLIGNRIFFRKSVIDNWILEQENKNTNNLSYETKIKPLKCEVNQNE